MDVPLVPDGALASLASGGVTVDLDITFAAQVVLFVLLFLALKPILFEPMIRLFEERERRISGAKNEARRMYAEADAKMAKYEEELLDVKRQAGEERDRLRAEGKRLEQQIIAKVRGETGAMLEEGKKRIAADAVTLRAELATNAETLARDIASRVLGREVQP